jgi:hypothetical protein
VSRNPVTEFTAAELRLLRSLRTPHRIQKFVEELAYNKRNTALSPRYALGEGRAHCLEGAALAAAALRANGYPPLLIDLEAERDDDHVLAVFRVRGHWGAIGKSNYSGLRYREPVHRSLRELAMSFFDDYFNLLGERTLRRVSTRPVDLRRFDHLHWMTTREPIWFISEHLCEIPHTRLLTPGQERSLTRVDARRKAAGFVGRVL